MLSANLRKGGASAEALALLLSDLQVDLAAFQELGPEQAEAIAEVMPHGSLEPDPVSGGMGLALRRPGEVTHVHLPHRNAHRVELTPDAWPDLPVGIEVINVHLTAPHQFPPWRALRERQQQVRGLLERGADPSSNALRTIGYQESIAFLNGEIDYDEMVRLIKRNSRRYAKRQRTWFRRYPAYLRIHADTAPDFFDLQ